MLPKFTAALLVLSFTAACESVTIAPPPEDQQPKFYNIPSI